MPSGDGAPGVPPDLGVVVSVQIDKARKHAAPGGKRSQRAACGCALAHARMIGIAVPRYRCDRAGGIDGDERILQNLDPASRRRVKEGAATSQDKAG